MTSTHSNIHQNLKIIGDVHQFWGKYVSITKGCEYSIQLGDLGFDFSFLQYVDPTHHRFLKGNHCRGDENPPHSLGDYGPAKLSKTEFFFIRGANSPDKHLRQEGVSWWRNEELSYLELSECISSYSRALPEIVLSHTCPKFLIPFLGGRLDWGSRTEVAMEQMWSIHQPKLWYFAHYHKSWNSQIGRTHFRCLNELETFVL